MELSYKMKGVKILRWNWVKSKIDDNVFFNCILCIFNSSL